MTSPGVLAPWEQAGFGPFDFVITAQAVAEVESVHPWASFEADPSRWWEARWRTRWGSRLRMAGPAPFTEEGYLADEAEGITRVADFAWVLDRHRRSGERGAVRPDGGPVGPWYRGVTRYPAHAYALGDVRLATSAEITAEIRAARRDGEDAEPRLVYPTCAGCGVALAAEGAPGRRVRSDKRWCERCKADEENRAKRDRRAVEPGPERLCPPCAEKGVRTVLGARQRTWCSDHRKAAAQAQRRERIRLERLAAEGGLPCPAYPRCQVDVYGSATCHLEPLETSL